ncbi:MAG TPA: hypothetical protein VL967_00965 [Terracidiphilus sp.]|nr:hypothetical protein [Terracidiphilus sp.]
MRKHWISVLILTCAPIALVPQVQAPESPIRLVREVVYNELHDHQMHGYWRYRVEKQSQQTILEEQVETTEGPITRLVASHGRLLDAEEERAERERLERLLKSPAEQARHRQDYVDDEKRIGRILGLLPDAFLYEDAGTLNGFAHLRFRPNPDYPPHSIEAHIFHAMRGELWVDLRCKRLARLDGQLQENVDFGFGILGRLYKGGWFQLQRTEVSPTDWKTERLEIHMNGRAFFFKTISRETSEVRSGFAPVPPAMTLTQGIKLLVLLPAAASVTTAAFPSPH